MADLPTEQRSSPTHGREGLSAMLLVASLVGWPALSALPGLAGVDSRIFSIPFRAALLVAAVVLLTSARPPTQGRTFFAHYAFALFWALYVVRLIVDATLNQGAMRLSPAEYFAYAIGTGLVPALALARPISHPRLRQALLWAIVLGAIGCVSVAVMAVTGLTADLATLVQTRNEIDAMDTISIGHLGVTVALLCAFVLVRADMFALRLRLLMIGPLILGGFNVAMGSSKGPALALLVCVPLLFHLTFVTSYTRVTFRSFVFAGVVAIGAVILGRNAGSLIVIGRFAAAMSGADAGSVDVRLHLLQDAWRVFGSSPVLGAGTEPLGFYPHNVVLEAFMAVGTVGGMAFVVLTLLSGVSALRLIFRRSPSAWLGLLLIQYTLGDMVSSSIYMSAATWALRLLVIVQDASEQSATTPREVYESPRAVPSGTPA